MLGVWGCSPICWGFGGISTWGDHMLILVHSCSSLCLMFLLWLQLLLLQLRWCFSGLSSVSSVTMAPSLMGLPVTLDQCGVVQPPCLVPRGSGGVIGHASVPQQQPPSLMPLLAYANHAMGSPQVDFFFRVEPPTILYIICWCLFWCLLSTFRCPVGCHIHLWGLNH